MNHEKGKEKGYAHETTDEVPIIHLVSQRDKISDREVMEALQDEYGDEGQYKMSIIETHLMSLRAVGIIEIQELPGRE